MSSEYTTPVIRVSGLVQEETALTDEDLDRTPGAIEDISRLAEGFKGRAVPLGPILDGARPLQGADHVTVISDDGRYRASIPLSELQGFGWIVFRLGDEPLPRESGGPFRAVVPQGRTLCWNVKSVSELRVTAGKESDSVPAQPQH